VRRCAMEAACLVDLRWSKRPRISCFCNNLTTLPVPLLSFFQHASSCETTLNTTLAGLNITIVLTSYAHLTAVGCSPLFWATR
jgi:hypothetical protein